MLAGVCLRIMMVIQFSPLILILGRASDNFLYPNGQRKNPSCLGLGFHLEEAVGFEPTVAINYDSFQDCSVRPLRHASVPLSLEENRTPVE